MISAFEWMVAMRYLRPRRQEGFVSLIAIFSLLGIFLGVATLIIVMSVMNGFRAELLSRILGLNGHLTVYGPPAGLTGYDGLRDIIIKVPGVEAAYPMVESQVIASVGGVARGAIVRGLPLDAIRARPILADNVVSGSLDGLGPDDGVLIGSRLAERMGLSVGDKITLISPKGIVTAFGSVPRVRAYTVAATFEIGMYEYDLNYIFMDLPAAQVFFNLPGAVNAIEAFTDNPDEAARVAARVRTTIEGAGIVHDWQRANAGFFNAIQVERNVMFLILTLIIVVAAFNIISSLIMLVKDKGRDIAVLRTLGATRGSIMRIFVIAGSSIGVLGTVLGAVGGLLFARNIEAIRHALQSLIGTDLFNAEIYFLSQLPAEVDPVEVALVTAMALVLSFLATLYPSWRAARIDPAEALRYE